jgi:hypothetical protein
MREPPHVIVARRALHRAVPAAALMACIALLSGCAVVTTTAAVGSAAVSAASAAVSIGAAAVSVTVDAAVGTAKIVGNAVAGDDEPTESK